MVTPQKKWVWVLEPSDGILAEGAIALLVTLSGSALFASWKLLQFPSRLIVKVIRAIFMGASAQWCRDAVLAFVTPVCYVACDLFFFFRTHVLTTLAYCMTRLMRPCFFEKMQPDFWKSLSIYECCVIISGLRGTHRVGLEWFTLHVSIFKFWDFVNMSS